ncbi:hypothetical protein UlMin_042075 [Ulmus minor]
MLGRVGCEFISSTILQELKILMTPFLLMRLTKALQFLRDKVGVEQATYKNRQCLYLSERVPNTLVITNCEVVKWRFNEEARSPFVKKYKTIIHPGEVNRIRELPQNSKIVGTHIDSPNVLIWDVEAQPNCHAVLGATNSSPDLLLTGHKDNAEFALAMCPTNPFVLSGGKDKLVVLWSIQDQISQASKGVGNNYKLTDSPIGPRGIYYGHKDTIEDEFCSVGDNSCLVLWDSRSGSTPIVKFMTPFFPSSQYLLNRSADNTINRFDRRNLTSGDGMKVFFECNLYQAHATYNLGCTLQLLQSILKVSYVTHHLILSAQPYSTSCRVQHYANFAS